MEFYYSSSETLCEKLFGQNIIKITEVELQKNYTIEKLKELCTTLEKSKVGNKAQLVTTIFNSIYPTN